MGTTCLLNIFHTVPSRLEHVIYLVDHVNSLLLTMRRFTHSPPPTSPRYSSGRPRYDIDGDEVHYPTRPVDKDKAEQELTINIKKATSPEEIAPKQKHVRSEITLRAFKRRLDIEHSGLLECIVYTWDYHSSISIWQGLRVQPILSDEVQTFKALITVHKLLQEGHPVVRFSHSTLLQFTITVRTVDTQRSTWSDGLAGNMRTDCWS